MKYEEVKYLIILFVIALIIRLVVFNEMADQPGDGAYRISLTLNWLKNPYFIIGDLWPPLYLYLTAFMVKILGDSFYSIRYISVIFGTIIIFPYYYLVKLLFNKKIASISTMVLVFLSIHIQYSTFAMSEVPFVFFLITSLYFLFRYKNSDDRKMVSLMTSAIFLNFASMIRYEGWLFIPIMAIFTLDKISDLKNILRFKDNKTIYFYSFIIVSSLFPIFWMIGNYQIHGDALYGQSWSDNWIKINTALNMDSQWLNPPLIKKIITWPGVILHTLNIVSIFALLGLLISLYKKKNLEFLSIFFFLIVIFTIKLVNITMLPQPRHFIMPILFLIPYSVIGLYDGINYLDVRLHRKNKNERENEIDKNFKGSENKNLTKIVPIVVIGIYILASSYGAIYNPYIIPNYVFDIAKWLRTNVKSNETVLLDEKNWWSLHILIFSGLNTTFTGDYLKTYEFVTNQVRIIPGGGKKLDETTVIKYLEDKPTYLVYFPNGKLERILNFSEGCKNEIVVNYSFKCRYENRYYDIYEIKSNN